METMHNKIADFVVKYSSKSTRTLLGITSNVEPTHIRVLAMSAEEAVSKPIPKLGYPCHKLIVLIGADKKKYYTLDGYLLDDYLLKSKISKRLVRYVGGVYTPITKASELGYNHKLTLINTKLLWSLRIDGFYKHLDGGFGEYVEPVKITGNTINIITPKERKFVTPTLDMAAIHHFEQRHPGIKFKLNGRPFTTSDLIDDTATLMKGKLVYLQESEFTPTVTMVQEDLELTGLTVNDAGEYELSEEYKELHNYEVVTFGNNEYLEDVVAEEGVVSTPTYYSLKHLIKTSGLIRPRFEQTYWMAYAEAYVKAYKLIESGEAPELIDYLDEEARIEYINCITK